jgi:hypothetical protein
MAKKKCDPKAWLIKDKDMWRVGFTRGDYSGPVAQIYYDDSWLNIATDDYEGHAMVNIETLPKLRQALAEVAKQIREAKKAAK